MNIDSATVSKSDRLSVTLTLSGAELAWLQYLAAVELEKGDTLAFSYGSQMATARELRSMTDRIDPHYVQACAVAKRDGLNVTDEQMLQIVKKAKQEQGL